MRSRIDAKTPVCTDSSAIQANDHVHVFRGLPLRHVEHLRKINEPEKPAIRVHGGENVQPVSFHEAGAFLLVRSRCDGDWIRIHDSRELGVRRRQRELAKRDAAGQPVLLIHDEQALLQMSKRLGGSHGGVRLADGHALSQRYEVCCHERAGGLLILRQQHLN